MYWLTVQVFKKQTLGVQTVFVPFTEYETIEIGVAFLASTATISLTSPPDQVPSSRNVVCRIWPVQCWKYKTVCDLTPESKDSPARAIPVPLNTPLVDRYAGFIGCDDLPPVWLDELEEFCGAFDPL